LPAFAFDNFRRSTISGIARIVADGIVLLVTEMVRQLAAFDKRFG
jgi:hypothetical protein